jgi:hypothetical protein
LGRCCCGVQRTIGEQLGQRRAQGFRDDAEIEDAEVAFAALDGTDEGAVQAAAVAADLWDRVL